MKQKLLQSLIFSILISFLWGIIFQKLLAYTSQGASTSFKYLYGFGHAAEFGLILLFIAVILCFLPSLLHKLILVVIASLFTVFLYIDYVVFSQFRIHINISMVDMFFGPDSGDIFIFTNAMYIKAFSIFAGLTILVALLWFISGQLVKRNLKRFPYYTGILMLVCVVLYHIAHAWASYLEYNPVTKQIHALPLTYPLYANKYLASKGFKVPERLERFEPTLMKYPLSDIRLGDIGKKYNIVVIFVDALRFDMADIEIAPNIMTFADKSFYFTKHNANSNHTRHGVFSFFYGLPGAYWDAALTDTISPVLIDTLLDQGYETGIFTNAAITSPEFHKTVFSKVPNLKRNVDGETMEEREVQLAADFIEFLQERDKSKPFFSFLFFDAPHAYGFDPNIYEPKFIPYEDKDYLSISSKTDREALFNQYKNAVGFTDLLIGRVLDQLDTLGYMEDTIVIITGDHGEEFNDLEKGYWGHNGNYSIYQTQVPFVLYWPGKGSGRFYHKTNHLDVPATILEELFKIETPTVDYTTGLNIFDTSDRPYTYMQGDEYAIKAGDTISIFRKLGPIETVDINYDFTEKKISPYILKGMLEDLSKFKQ